METVVRGAVGCGEPGFKPLADGNLLVVNDYPAGSGGDGVEVFDMVCPVVVADSLLVSLSLGDKD